LRFAGQVEIPAFGTTWDDAWERFSSVERFRQDNVRRGVERTRGGGDPRGVVLLERIFASSYPNAFWPRNPVAPLLLSRTHGKSRRRPSKAKNKALHRPRAHD